jgi:membrane protein required for colicin V production
MPIAFYDVVMLIVLIGATLWGVWKGMAWQVTSVASVVVSAAVAIHSSAAAAPYFPGQEPWNRYLAMFVLYCVTAAAIWIVFHFVSGIIDRVQLKEFDRQLGAAFGLAKGVLYCLVITFFAVTLSESARQKVLESRSGDLIARGIRNANPILPEDVRTYLGKYIDEFDAKLHAPPVGATPGAGEPVPGTGVAPPLPTSPSPPAAGQSGNSGATKKSLKERLLPSK